MFPNLVIGLFSSILPSIISAVATPRQVSGAGITVTPTSAGTGIASLVVSSVMMALGAAGLGTDAMHNIAAGAGALGVVLSTISHMHVISGSNANTLAIVADLFAQVAAYKSMGLPAVTANLGASTEQLSAMVAQASVLPGDVVLPVAPVEAPLVAASTVALAS